MSMEFLTMLPIPPATSPLAMLVPSFTLSDDLSTAFVAISVAEASRSSLLPMSIPFLCLVFPPRVWVNAAGTSIQVQQRAEVRIERRCLVAQLTCARPRGTVGLARITLCCTIFHTLAD